jgi:rfaE bifunctional protein nucleotidyltransferase chain/domain
MPLLPSILKEKMQGQNLKTTLVRGRIGIIDAALVRWLEKIKQHPGQLLMYVTESIYDGFIPKSHTYEFLTALSVVDCIIENKSQFERAIQNSNAVLVDIPGEELHQYSVERVLKKWAASTPQKVYKGKPKHEFSRLVDLKELVEHYGSTPHKRKIKIGLVSGSFDLIHPGHVRYIKAARELGDVVIVATMSTNSIQQQEKNINGDRPIYSQEDRVKVLSSLRAVDYIVVFDQLDCKKVIRTLKPDFFIKNEKDLSRKIVKEECEIVETLGGKVVITRDNTGYSSTEIIDHIRHIEGNVMSLNEKMK